MPPESWTSARTRMLAAPAASAGTKKSAFSCVRKRGRPPGAKRWRSAAATWNATVKVWAARDLVLQGGVESDFTQLLDFPLLGFERLLFKFLRVFPDYMFDLDT